jgi:immune inhibitor A
LSCFACGITAFGINLWVQDPNFLDGFLVGEPVDVEVIVPADLPSSPSQASGYTPSITNPTLVTLLSTHIPINEPIDLARRLEGKENLPLTLPVDNLNRQVGEQETFWVINTDTAENFQIETTLAAVTDHLYFWVENGVEYSRNALNKLAADFEENIYPTNQEFFGSEWFPGVDEDPHIYVIYAGGLGNSVAGYYSSVDEYHPDVSGFSNSHETFMLNSDNVSLSNQYTYGVLAHEFQHMIHWYQDKNETSWLNEGFSELATLLTGYRDEPTHDYYFADDPDTQLNDWPNDPNSTTPHYGNAFLFVAYFMDRFGSEATKALVADELNGLLSVDKVLADLSLIDPDTGNRITADDVFLDWVVTNHLKDAYNVTDRFKYTSYPQAPYFDITEIIHNCSTGELARDVHQYAADYIKLDCTGDITLRFSGQETVELLPENPIEGSYAFWSNKGDHSNMRLTREFDFRNVSGPITFDYKTWFDLEEDYDYIFLEISTDGKDWRIIRTPSSTSENPSGNSYGWGYNGLSGEPGIWIEESVDLSRYAGELIQIRFEYITDASVYGEGFLLDEVSVPEIGYSTGFEEDDGGWFAEGFVRVENSLPQTFRLALIHLGPEPRVEYLALTEGNQLELELNLEDDGNYPVVLVVTGTTRFTRQKANYWFALSQD